MASARRAICEVEPAPCGRRLTMRPSLACWLFAFVSGCGPGGRSTPGTPPPHSPSPVDASPDSPPLETTPLGMNDLSMFLPQPNAREQPVVAAMDDLLTPDGSHVALVPLALFSRLVTDHHDIMYDYVDFQVFAIRFDLCDRLTPVPCPEGADGSLRLVFQAIARSNIGLADLGVHAFYSIPPAEIPAAINQLRFIA